MNLILLNMETRVAKEVIRDDAFEMWMHCEADNRYLAAPAAFYSRNDIQPEQIYLYLEFTDDTKGDTSFLNCSEKMHKAMLRHNLYPKIILNALKNG